MKTIKNDPPASFAAIRQRLDPNHRYLVLEKKLAPDETFDFTEIVATLNVLGLKQVHWKLHVNRIDGVGWLVVQFNNGRLGDVMEKLLRTGIGRKMKIFAYGSRAGTSGNGGETSK